MTYLHDFVGLSQHTRVHGRRWPFAKPGQDSKESCRERKRRKRRDRRRDLIVLVILWLVHVMSSRSRSPGRRLP